MPSQPSRDKDDTPGRRRPAGGQCTAHTTSGSPCRRRAVAGLKVCTLHGGGTASSVRASTRASISQQAATLWGISPDTGGVSVAEELNKLARNKLADVLALRIKISSEDTKRHIGTLTETHTVTEYDIQGTVQSKEGTQESRTKRAGTSVWVQELHKAEAELIQILRLLHEVTGGTEEVDTKRLRIQTAREAARLLKSFPGISVDEVVAEVSKSA